MSLQSMAWNGLDAMKRALGKVYLVGAGPGAPDLLTIRAAEILRRADVVFHDALVHPEILALAARADHIPVGKRCGRFSTVQAFINKRLVDAAHNNAVVVRLKGGDPMLFGRAQEELAALKSAGIECEVVPGVTAALGAAAEAGVSLTRRGAARSVAFVTPRVGEGEAHSTWAATVAAADTSVIYMGAGQAEHVTNALLAAGVRPEIPVLVAESATLPAARRIRLKLRELPTISHLNIAGPTLILVGPVFGEIENAILPSRLRQRDAA